MDIEIVDLTRFHPAWTVYELTREEGYLRAANITEESFEEYFPDIWHMMAFRGNCKLACLIEDDNLTRDEIWKATQSVPGRREVPDKEQRDKELARIREEKQEEYEKFHNFHVEHPVVDYVKVQPDYRRQGIATEMYIQMGTWLAERGWKLYASGIQTDAAEALWTSFIREDYPTGVETHNGKKRHYLDYRGES